MGGSEPVSISRPAQVELVLRRPGYPERRMLLSPGVTQIGRAEDNDIVLSDVGVSRRHARIEVGEAGVRITDIGSGNGIFYRGSRFPSSLHQTCQRSIASFRSAPAARASYPKERPVQRRSAPAASRLTDSR